MAFLGAFTRSLCPFGGVRRLLDVAIKEMSHQWMFFQSCSWLMCAGVPRSSGFSPPHQDVSCGAGPPADTLRAALRKCCVGACEPAPKLAG